MFILCVVCVWHAIVVVIQRATSDQIAVQADTIAVIVLGSIYVSLLLTFFIWNRILVSETPKLQ